MGDASEAQSSSKRSIKSASVAPLVLPFGHRRCTFGQCTRALRCAVTAASGQGVGRAAYDTAVAEQPFELELDEDMEHLQDAHPASSTSTRTQLLTIQGEQYKFSCAHFVAYQGFRERLHGHNYTVSIRIKGPVQQTNGYVVDFGELKAALRKVCKELNERFIVPLESDVIRMDIDHDAGTLKMDCEDGAHFRMPLDDCALLPLVHSTAEELAELLHARLSSELISTSLKDFNVDDQYVLEVTVSERPTQSAAYRARVTAAASPPPRRTAAL